LTEIILLILQPVYHSQLSAGLAATVQPCRLLDVCFSLAAAAFAAVMKACYEDLAIAEHSYPCFAVFFQLQQQISCLAR